MAEVQRLRAIENEKTANFQKDRAITNEKEADKQRNAAEIAKNDATRQSYLATSKAMAIKSKISPDIELQALLAQHAYIFNDRYKGYQYDDDVYNGLFAALKSFNDPLTQNLQGHEKGACRSLVTHLASKQIFSGGSDGRILKWTYNNNKWASEELVGARSDYHVFSIAVSTDGSLLVAGGSAFGETQNNYVELYDLKNKGAAPKKISGYVHDIDNLVFAHDDKGFYSRDNAGFSIKFCDLTKTAEIINSKEKINGMSLSPDGKFLAGAGNNGTLYLWDLKSNYQVKTLYKNPRALSAVGFSRDGNRLVIGDVNGQVRIIYLDNSSSPRLLSGHTSTIEEIVFNHNGKFMATASNDKTVRLWNLEKLNQQPIVLSDHADWVRTAVFTVDDEQLLAGINSNSDKARETIHAWPTNMQTMSGLLCGYVKRNLTADEWRIYVDEEGNLKYEKTCNNIQDK